MSMNDIMQDLNTENAWILLLNARECCRGLLYCYIHGIEEQAMTKLWQTYLEMDNEYQRRVELTIILAITAYIEPPVQQVPIERRHQYIENEYGPYTILIYAAMFRYMPYDKQANMPEDAIYRNLRFIYPLIIREDIKLTERNPPIMHRVLQRVIDEVGE